MKQKNDPTLAQYRVQALDRALDLLDCFSYQSREMSLSDLANQTGLNKTTAKRILANLTNRGYLQQDHETKRYFLGLRLFELGGIVYSSFSLRKAAASHMRRLRDRAGLTVLLGVLRDDHLVYVEKLDGTGVIRISSDIGWRRRSSFGMLGMVLMASLPPEKVSQLLNEYPLEAYTPYSITDRDAFSLRLAQIHQDGYLFEKEEAHLGIVGIAAPVRDYSRAVVATVGVAMTARQYDEEQNAEKKLVEMVKKTAKDISTDLGYLGI